MPVGKFMTLSQSQVKIGLHILEDEYFKYVAGAIHCVLNPTDHNLNYEEIKDGLNSGNSCRNSVSNSLLSCLLYKSKAKKNYKIRIVPVFCAKVKFGILTIGGYKDRGKFNSIS
jgi:hypothetical protein